MKDPFRSDKKLNLVIRGILFSLLLSVSMICGPHLSFAAQQIPLKRVHIIYGLNPNFPAHQLFTKGLQDVFGQSSDKFQVEYSFEYLDLGLGRADENYRTLLAEFLKRKYLLKTKPDLIIAHLTPANTFLVKYADEIIPGVPVVFTGDQPGMIPLKDIPSNFAGIVREGNPAPAVSLILQAQPNTKKIYIVMGDSPQEKKIRISFAKDLAMFADKVEMVYLNQLPFPRMMEIIKGIRGPSVILYISFFQDVTKKNFIPAKVAGIISQSANVPTYGISAPYMGQGVVGGYQFSARVVGEKAAELGTKILLGSKISDFPREQTAATAEYRFDWRALKRWGIDERRLPRESVFEYRPPTLWDAYKWQIIGGFILVLVETFLILLLLVNIKKRKKGEEVLRESEEKYRTLFENAGEAIFVALDGKVVFVNPMTVTTTGYSREELASRPFVDFIHADDRDMVIDRHVSRLKGESIPPRYSFRILHKNGGFRWVQLGTILINWQGKPATLNFMTDISERKQAEEKEMETNALLRIAGDKAKLGGWSVNLEENRVIWSDQVAAIHEMPAGFSPLVEEGIKFYAPEWKERITSVFTDCAQKGIPYDEEMEIITAGGKRVWVKTIGEAVKDEAGNIVKVQGAFQDISERKQAEVEKLRLEERLRRAEKMEALGHLAGGVAHDLNNILGVLSGYSELLLAEIPEGQKTRIHVEKILQSTEKGAAIIQDLLTLARRGVMSAEVVQINDIISCFTKTLAFENIRDYHPGVTFRVECDPNLFNIKGSPVHLEKTLMNLVSNAAEAISGEGEVMIRTENHYLESAIEGYEEVREGDYVVLTVSDTGAGIADEYRDKIFEPFYTKKSMGRSGTGLGLTIVWGTVKDHNGYIDVQSRIGEGTTFTLYFPVTRDERTALQPRAPVERYMGRGETVLVVDDIVEQSEVASELLQKLGYRVHSVSSGEEALEYLKENRVDILILDMIMEPGMDGMETYRRVLEIHPKQKALLVSGFSETDRVQKAQILGAGTYVKKPYVMETIGLAIRKELER